MNKDSGFGRTCEVLGSSFWLLQPSFDFLDGMTVMAVEEEQVLWKLWRGLTIPVAGTSSGVPRIKEERRGGGGRGGFVLLSYGSLHT